MSSNRNYSTEREQALLYCTDREVSSTIKDMLKEQISNFITKNETKLEIAFFVGGFIFDIWMLAAPDEIFSVLQQLVYLLIIASLIHFELLHRLNSWRPKGLIISKIWTYRTLVLHFLLGSLLSVYSLFYIKSSSIFSSMFFYK